jgi:hypothetical protein
LERQPPQDRRHKASFPRQRMSSGSENLQRQDRSQWFRRQEHPLPLEETPTLELQPC